MTKGDGTSDRNHVEVRLVIVRPVDLQAYAALDSIFAALRPQPVLAGLPIVELYDGEVGRYQLGEVEVALVALSTRNPADLDEQRGKLFVDGWHHWDAAWLELLAYQTFEADGVLQETGWPLDAQYGGSPPFDGVIRDICGRGELIAFDVKSAAGSGIGLLKIRFQPEADRWARRHNLGDVDVGVHCHGFTPTCEVLGPEMRRMLGAQRVALQQPATLPHTFTYDLQALSGASVTTTIQAAGDIIMSGWVGGGRQASVEAVMRKHLREKAVFAERHGRPFFLVYVRPSGAGASDSRPAEVVQAAQRLDAARESDWWLGTLLLDFVSGGMARYGHMRENVRWPNGSSAFTLQRTLLMMERMERSPAEQAQDSLRRDGETQ
jgi:hypothetical protein